MWVALYKLNMIIFVDSDSEYFISLLAFNNNGDGEATASSVRTAPLGKTAHSPERDGGAIWCSCRDVIVITW